MLRSDEYTFCSSSCFNWEEKKEAKRNVFIK